MVDHDPIVFLWEGSPWASKVQAYLALRGIAYIVCPQPVYLPRPDLTALGINYRRIPVVSRGRDIYCDSLLILDKLEEWYPSAQHKALGAKDNTGKALEKLLEKWTDVAVFAHAAASIPSDLELVKDPAFQKDREELWGRPWTKAEQDRLRPSGLANLRTHMDFLEELLNDGRQWVLGAEGPGLADIHACWIFNWMFSIPGAMPDNFFNAKHYPSAIAWRERYDEAITKAKHNAPKPKELFGNDAVNRILNSEFFDHKLNVEEDPSGFKAGDGIEVYPIDTGFTHRDSGKLVGLTTQEVILSTTTKQAGNEIRLHFPRWNFGIETTATAQA